MNIRDFFGGNGRDEAPSLSPVGTVSDPLVREIESESYDETTSTHTNEKRTYGSRDTAEPNLIVANEEFTADVFKGFTAVAGKQRIGVRCTLRAPQVIPRDTTFVIHLFVDVSGSMEGGLGDSHTSRLQMIQGGIRAMNQSLQPLVRKGLKVKLSLHTFSTRCEEKVPTTEATSDYLRSMDWSPHLQSDSLTNIWDCVRAVREDIRDHPSRSDESHTYIILSDGQHTTQSSAPEGDVQVFDHAIGIGTSHEYDPTILSRISKHGIEACPDEMSLSATLLRLGCSSYMIQAKDVTMKLNGQVHEVKQWIAGTQVLFSALIPEHSDVSLNYRGRFGTSHVSGRMLLPTQSLPRKSRRSQRHVTELCRLNQDSTEALMRMGDRFDFLILRGMIRRCEAMVTRFTEDSWCHRVAQGLFSTWDSLKDRMFLPTLDRGLSIQSAIRQTSANYYDTQATENTQMYSDMAL